MSYTFPKVLPPSIVSCNFGYTPDTVLYFCDVGWQVYCKMMVVTVCTISLWALAVTTPVSIDSATIALNDWLSGTVKLGSQLLDLLRSYSIKKNNKYTIHVLREGDKWADTEELTATRKLTAIQPHSPMHQTDGHTTTNLQTDSHTTLKPDASDWLSHDHKARHMTVTRPQSLTHQTDGHMTTNPKTLCCCVVCS